MNPIDFKALLDIKALQQSVQHNCNISDARHGVDYGLCTYLMKMREYYRWEAGLGFSELLGKEAVGDWLTQREALWDDLDEADFIPVELPGQTLDPFHSEAINEVLNPLGLAYSGGLGRSGKPHFFLAELIDRQELKQQTILFSGKELARDLASPPAMTMGGVIHVRRESLQRMLWEKLENWRWSRPDNAMGRAFSCYPFDEDLDAALEMMTTHESNLLLLHEKGEELAGGWLGDEWNEMLGDIIHTPAEVAARAVRDHLSDCSVTLPNLLARGDEPSVHFLIGNLTAMQKSLFPALIDAYQVWHESRGESDALQVAAGRGVGHWRAVADQMIKLYREKGGDAADAIRELSEASQLKI